MTGKELIYKTMRHEETEAVPWVPFAGVHAGYLKRYSPEEVLTDADKLVESLLEVNRLYQPDGMPIYFDLQLEAEIFGCELKWTEDSPPSVLTHVFSDTNELPEPVIKEEYGRLPMVLEVTRRIKEAVGDETALYALYCGPFTLASHLRGSNIFMDMARDPEYVKELMDWCTEIAIQMTDYYIDCGIDVIAPVDPLISQISPKHFNKYCSQPYKRIFDHIRERKVFSSFFVCGNAIKNIEVMCQTGPDAISVDENLPIKEAKDITDQYNVVIGGNIPLTTVMLFGQQQDNMKYVLDLLDAVDHKNLIVSPGCDMPYRVPVQNAIACAQAVHDPEGTREFIKNYQKQDNFAGIEVELPNYDSPDRPIVELFSLDPDSCAACTYMLKVFDEARRELGGKADWGDYRYNKIEDIARMQKVGVKNLPSMYINGQLRYDSLIPSKEELVEEIKAVL